MDEDDVINPLLDEDEREILEDESYIEFLSNAYATMYESKDTKEEDALLKQFGL